MDPMIAERLVAATAPFAGKTLAMSEMCPLAVVASVIRSVLDVAAEVCDSRWFVAADRHEVDGESTVSTAMTFAQLSELIGDADRLLDFRGEELLAYVGCYPEGAALYLRIHILDEGEDDAYRGRVAAFDLSADENVAAAARRILERAGIAHHCMASPLYFEQQSAERGAG